MEANQSEKEEEEWVRNRRESVNESEIKRLGKKIWGEKKTVKSIKERNNEKKRKEKEKQDNFNTKQRNKKINKGREKEKERGEREREREKMWERQKIL